MPVGWQCTKCTYQHHAPGKRCVMCAELRVNKEAMQRFVLGKPIPQEHKNNCSTVAPLNTAPAAPAVKLVAVSAPPVNNPYAKKPPPSSGHNAQRSRRPASSPSFSPTNPQENVASGPHQPSIPPNATVGNTAKLNWKQPAAPPSSSTDSSHHREASLVPTKRPPVPSSQQTAPSKPVPQNPFTMAATKKRPRPSQLQFQPGPVPYDSIAAKTWIYPTADHYPKRQYQYEIAKSAILENTLVSLPTGLGKTLIAAVVLYNYYRWFPTGKVMFLAPTLPLVHQQVQACYEIMGIPAADTAVVTGRMPANKRSVTWRKKRVWRRARLMT